MKRMEVLERALMLRFVVWELRILSQGEVQKGLLEPTDLEFLYAAFLGHLVQECLTNACIHIAKVLDVLPVGESGFLECG